MALTFTLDHRQGLAPRQSRTLTQGTLSIGRAAGNDWVLPDPDRTLSKTHCVISIEAGRPVLTDLSTNGVFVNGAREPTQRDSRTVLTDGDEVRLGDYVVGVTILDDALAGAEDTFGFAAPDATAGAPAALRRGSPDPLGEDPLDAPFGEAAAEAPFRHPTPPAPPPPLRPADPFDVLDEQQRRPGALDDDLFHGVTPSELWQGPSQPDNADAPAHAFAAPRPIAPAPFDELDFDALLGDTPPGQPTVAPPPPPAPPPPLAAPPAAMAPPPAPATPRAPPAPAEDAAELLAAFLGGAGLAEPRLAGQAPEAAMRAAGALFRAMVEGLRDVLMSRSAIKNEFRMEQTMLRAKDNNALKFSVTPEEAMAALLLPDRPGYKAPLDAVREAYDDVRSHEMAVMAGVQTALIGLLRRFDPAALEQRLQPGMLDALLPAARRARTWELFCATYKEIAREAEDDFQSVFGREFARAYDAQTRKL